jgi:hypothetical protein
MASLKSFEPAVMPVTSDCVPSTLAIVVGITSSRRVASAVSDLTSVPSPCIGIEITSARLFGLIWVVTGSDIWPEASALSVISLMPCWMAGDVTSSACTTTCAGSGPPGNAAWMRS